MDSQKHEMNEKRLIRWLLIATLALLICVLGLQIRQMLRSAAPAGDTLSQDTASAPPPQITEPAAPPAAGDASAREAALIEDIQALNPSLSADGLSALSGKELKQLREAGAPGLPIGLSAAAYAAEEYAGTLEMDSITWEAEPELDEFPAHYEVELRHVTLGDFDYEIDAYTGEVLKGAPNILQTASAPAASGAGAAAPPAPKTETSQSAAVSADSGAQSALIGEAAAKAAAFAHAGVLEADAARVKCKLDWEDGRQVYEVEFDAGRLEYEYEIDAASGAVLKAETDS